MDWNNKELEKIIQEMESMDFELTGFMDDEMAKIIEDANVEDFDA